MADMTTLVAGAPNLPGQIWIIRRLFAGDTNEGAWEVAEEAGRLYGTDPATAHEALQIANELTEGAA